MKLLPICLSIILLSTGCTKVCPTGYGPTDCDATWSSRIEGTWQGVNASAGITINIETFTATRFNIDGRIVGDLEDHNRLLIPAQDYLHPITGETINVTGTGNLANVNVVNANGSTSSQGTRLILDLTYVIQGQTTTIVEEYER